MKKNKDKNKSPITKIEKMVATTDDWYPNYEGDKVRVFLLHDSRQKFVRIAVWGADDFGLELDFAGTEEENTAKFNELKENLYDTLPEPLTQAYLRNLGFRNA